MFDFLKKKISGFVEKFTGIPIEKQKMTEERTSVKTEPADKVKSTEKTDSSSSQVTDVSASDPGKTECPVPEQKIAQLVSESYLTSTAREREFPVKQTKKPKQQSRKKEAEKTIPIKVIVTGDPVTTEKKPETMAAPVLPEQPKDKTMELKLGTFKQLKSILSKEVEIEEGDIKDLLDNFELEMLESDVDMAVASAIREDLAKKLLGARIKKEDLKEFIKSRIREILIKAVSNKDIFDITDVVKQKDKPAKVMFLGPNGAGKTTTIAKVANLLMKNNQKVILAAADTFRAAAIEQMEVHANRLGVKLIKREYGSDTTSVAYDAVNYSKAHNIDAVLIDTAGRQDTNINLVNELKKMDRVIKPDLKVYIGESIAGNATIEQLSVFHKEIGLNGVILTKLDCDPKGGVVLSINKATGIPIIYLGTGQKYEDLEAFEPERIVERILS